MTLGQSAALAGLAHPFICTMRELASDLRGLFQICRQEFQGSIGKGPHLVWLPEAAAEGWTSEYAIGTQQVLVEPR